LEILEKYGWQVLPTCYIVLTWAHQSLTCSQNWRNHSMRSIEKVSNEVTRVIRRINNEGVLQDLPRRWTAVIKHNGDYTEGL
jgi:hypothetical protein